jgi:hypothetical protein
MLSISCSFCANHIYFEGLGATGGAIARAAVGNALTQGVSIAAGLQSGFNWRGVVASGAAMGVSAMVKGNLTNNGKDPSSFGIELATHAASSVTQQLVQNGKVSLATVASDAFGNALGTSLADSITKPSLPRSMRNLPQDQQDRIFDLAQKAGLNAWSSDDKYQIFKDATDLRFSKEAQNLSSSEIWNRTSKALGLLGATPDQLEGLESTYVDAGLLRNPRVDIVPLKIEDVALEDVVDDIADLDSRPAAFLGNRSIDTGVIGIGKVLDEFGQYVDSNPFAKYALEGLDFVSGPVIYGVRHTPGVEKLATYATNEVSNFFADGLAGAGRSDTETNYGGIGGTAILFAGASGFLALAHAAVRFAPSSGGFASPNRQIGAVGNISNARTPRTIAPENYKGRYNAERHKNGLPRLPDDYDAHHRIPQVFKDHPEFSEFDFHAPANSLAC